MSAHGSLLSCLYLGTARNHLNLITTCNSCLFHLYIKGPSSNLNPAFYCRTQFIIVWSSIFLQSFRNFVSLILVVAVLFLQTFSSMKQSSSTIFLFFFRSSISYLLLPASRL